MKKETLKEAIERLYPINIMYGGDNNAVSRSIFVEGVKWEQEQNKNKYSEEEVYKLTLDALDLGMTIRQNQLNGYSDKSGKELHKEWFEQFKKQIKL